MSEVELSEIVADVIAKGSFQASAEQWKVLSAITQCRTAALGGHLYKCSECSAYQPRYHSCRNRHCPKCQGGKTAEWLEARASELLPVPYFHLVFTIPKELHQLTLSNKKVALDLLFKAVSKTIKQVAARRYKGKVGFFSILHTWNQKLEFHPHIHCVVPGVVLRHGDKVKRVRENYFLPRKILSVVFRAVFLRLLEKAEKQGKLNHSGTKGTLEAAARREWVTYAKKPFASPEVVLKYLACYTHRIAISNHRIMDYKNGLVSFQYRDRKQGGVKKLCRLPAEHFVRRFLLHTVPHQFVRIRHIGFLANGQRKHALEVLRAALPQKQVECDSALPRKPECKECGSGELVLIQKLSPVRFAGSTLRKIKVMPLVA